MPDVIGQQNQNQNSLVTHSQLVTVKANGELGTGTSVTDDDIPKSVYYISLGTSAGLGHAGSALGGMGAGIMPNLLPEYLDLGYSWASDAAMFMVPSFEGRWAAALNIAITKLAGKVWDLKSETPTLMSRMHDLINTWEYRRSWQYAISKLARSVMCCDNGAFIEIMRSSKGPGSRITGLFVLDSLRCMRTGVPDQPVLYRDMLGKQHVLNDYQVLDIVDMPDPTASFYGVGMCATRRAYKSIRILNAIDQFLLEKVTGARPLALDFITGINDKQLLEILTTQEAQRKNKGISIYGGTVLIPTIKPDKIDHVRIPIADLPEGFDRMAEISAARLDYANALGIDPQELQPMTGQQLGAGAQSQVLDEKAQGKGLTFIWQELQYVINNYVLPDSVTFYPVENDNRDRKAKADADTVEATYVTTMYEKGLLTRDEGRQILADDNIIPKQMIATDITPSQTVATDEKVEAPGANDVANANANVLAAPALVTAKPNGVPKP